MGADKGTGYVDGTVVDDPPVIVVAGPAGVTMPSPPLSPHLRHIRIPTAATVLLASPPLSLAASPVHSISICTEHDGLLATYDKDAALPMLDRRCNVCGLGGFLTFSLGTFFCWSAVWVLAGHDPTHSTRGVPMLWHSAETLSHGVALYVTLMAVLFHVADVQRHFTRTNRVALQYAATAFTTPGVYRGLQQGLAACGTRCFPVLSSQALAQLGVVGWLVIAAALITVGALLTHHVKQALAHGRQFAARYTGQFVGLLCCFGLMAVIGPHWGRVRLHLHHYMWASALSLFCVFDTRFSSLAQAALIGVITQELSFRGVSPFFEPVK